MKNQNYDGVLFDLDGTLLDTANDLGEALNYVLTKYGLPTVAREIYRPIASDGALGLLTLGFAEKLINYDYEQLRKEFLDYYQENIAAHTCLYAGIEALLKELNSKNILWGVVTNKPEGLTRLLLPNYPIFDSCAVMVGGDTLATRKPDPAPLMYACEQTDLDPTRCIYVGDAPRDIEAGNSANMFTIAVEWGYIKNVQDCQSWNADMIIKSPQEIIEITL